MRLLCLSAALVALGCGGSTAAGDDTADGAGEGGSDELPDADEPEDPGVEVPPPYDVSFDARDWGEVEFIDTAVPDLPYVAECGNAIVDDGEECDDGNRLNADGCDWLCRIGDGDPRPAPDPGVDDYVAEEGGPAEIPIEEGGGRHEYQPPLEWTGEAFATAFFEALPSPTPGIDYELIRFLRFARDGRRLDRDWVYPVSPGVGECTPRLDLAWTGTGFGLFFSICGVGIVFLELDAVGKPLGEPRLVEADPCVMAVAADWNGTDLTLAWLSERYDGAACPGRPPNALRMARLDRHGAAEGLPGPTVVAADGVLALDVASGPDGSAVVSDFLRSLDDDLRGMRLLRVDAGLTGVVRSGVLGPGQTYSDVRRVGEEWYTAWTMPTSEPEELSRRAVCVARFVSAGELAAPPVCTLPAGGDLLMTETVRLAAGDDGLAVISDSTDFVTGAAARLYFLRTDLGGVPVGPLHDVLEDPDDGVYGNMAAVEWADDGFGVLFSSNRHPLAMRFFRRAE